MRSTNGKWKRALKEALRKKQDEVFFKLLYHQYKELMLAVIRSRFVAYDRAFEPEDILLEVFVRIGKNGLAPYAEDQLPTIGGYLYRVTVNCINSYFRKAHNKSLLPLPEHEIAPKISFADPQIETFEFGNFLDQHLQQLTPPQREVFHLRLIEGYPYEEIAALMNITKANARQFLRQARKKLKASLPEDADVI